MKLYTIGFTQKTAKRFFEPLKQNGVECVIDIRLHPDGQLAGFSKEDLRYFLRELINCDYHHLLQLAPTDELLKAYRKDHNWAEYALGFENLMDQRGVPDALDPVLFEGKVCCLLCSEPTPEHCHRWLVAGRIARRWKDVEITHL